MRVMLLGVCLFVLGGCGGADQAKEVDQEDEGWAVTAWGERFEIFAECDPLEAGQLAHAYTHVTRLTDFSPVSSGTVSVVFRQQGGGAETFRQEQAVRAGIFRVPMTPKETGEFAISFLVETTDGNEEIPAGVVRVGRSGSAGGLISLAPSASGEGPGIAHDSGHETISFLKEQQWRTAFATDWSREGSLRVPVKGPGRVRIASGAEVILSAPLDGIVDPQSRLHVGMVVGRNDILARLAPRAAQNRTLPELEAEAEAARARLARLEKLLELQAVSVAEVEAARARVASLVPQLDAALGRGGMKRVEVVAPFSGQVAEVRVAPGQAVSAGDPLLRLVQTNPVWVEVMLAPWDALRAGKGIAGLVLKASGSSPLLVEGSDLSLVAQAPEVDPGTGTVATVFEVRGQTQLRPGTVVGAEVLLPEEELGVVVPASALIDDSGVQVVYVQVGGEGFLRHEVAVRARQGELALVDGLSPGRRVVTLGGGAIRRVTLMKSGSVEGHVH